MAFKKGASGNPAGRKKAITTVGEFRDAIAPDMPDIIAKLKEMAMGGDTAAIKLLLDRTYPALKPQSLPIAIPVGETLGQTGGNILNTTLQGGIPPDVGSLLIASLANLAKLSELEELSQRIARLEEKK